MKAMILAAAAIVMFSGCATARESLLGESEYQARAAIKLAMGPTSAPQKPGGAGEGPDSSKPHKTPNINIRLDGTRISYQP